MAFSIETITAPKSERLCKALSGSANIKVSHDDNPKQAVKEIDLEVGGEYLARRIRDKDGKFVQGPSEIMRLLLIEEEFVFFEKNGDRFPVPLQVLMDNEDFPNGHGRYRLLSKVKGVDFDNQL